MNVKYAGIFGKWFGGQSITSFFFVIYLPQHPLWFTYYAIQENYSMALTQHRINLYAIKFNYLKQYVTHETAIGRNPHNSSDSDFHITRRLGYLQAFCQNVVFTKKEYSLYFRKNITRLSVGLLRIGQFFVSSAKLCIK
jgi:hypothetical protein